MPASLLNETQARGDFHLEVEDVSREMNVDKMAFTVHSTGAGEKFAFVDTAPVATKFKGPVQAKAIRASRILMNPERWKNAVVGREEDVRRDQTGTIRIMMNQLATRMVQARWSQLTALVHAGTALCYDGVALYSAAHTFGKSGAQTNLLTATEVAALNVATPAAPTPEEFVDAVVGMIGHAMGWKDDEGMPMNQLAREWGVMVPNNMFGPAITAVHANNLAQGETNVLTAIKADGYSITPIVNAELTSTTEVHLVRLDGKRSGRAPFVMEIDTNGREEVEMAFFDENSDFFKDNHEVKVAANSIFDIAPGEPGHIFQGTFS